MSSTAVRAMGKVAIARSAQDQIGAFFAPHATVLMQPEPREFFEFAAVSPRPETLNLSSSGDRRAD